MLSILPSRIPFFIIITYIYEINNTIIIIPAHIPAPRQTASSGFTERRGSIYYYYQETKIQKFIHQEPIPVIVFTSLTIAGIRVAPPTNTTSSNA